MTIQAIIDHNNRAVDVLEQQNFKSAIANARKALQIQRQHALSLPLRRDETASIDQCMLLTKLDCKTFGVNSSSRTFIFSQGIPMPASFIDSTKGSAIILFNLALAHQLWAISEENSPSGLLVQARELYKLAFDLHKKANGDVLFPFAVINNLAVIEHRLGNTAESMKYFDFLAAKRRVGGLDEGEYW